MKHFLISIELNDKNENYLSTLGDRSTSHTDAPRTIAPSSPPLLASASASALADAPLLALLSTATSPPPAARRACASPRHPLVLLTHVIPTNFLFAPRVSRTPRSHLVRSTHPIALRYVTAVHIIVQNAKWVVGGVHETQVWVGTAALIVQIRKLLSRRVPVRAIVIRPITEPECLLLFSLNANETTVTVIRGRNQSLFWTTRYIYSQRVIGNRMRILAP